MNRNRPASSEPALQMCVECHSRGGINSLNSRAYLLRPNAAQSDPNQAPPDFLQKATPHWWTSDSDETIGWKHDRYDWGRLNGYWRSAYGVH
jgi:hypothetical protein